MTDMTDTRLFAVTPDGTRLPVIDVTNPAFAVPMTDAEIASLSAAALKEEEGRGPIQRFLIKFILKMMAGRSRLIAALQAADDGYLSGIPTYVMKLGPENLVPPYDTDIDKRVLSSPTVMSIRIRLVQLATLLAEALAPALAARPSAPLHVLEIAGGPSSASLNALLLLEQRGQLGDRQVRFVIYDIDTEGPVFAASMLDVLKSGPLAGRDIAIRHVPGNWSDTKALSRALANIPPDAVLAATSEGGLFEYGSDADITGVLATLAPRAGIVTGSVTRADRLNALLRRHSRAATTPRGLDRFAALIVPTGYAIEKTRPAPLSDQVLLTKS